MPIWGHVLEKLRHWAFARHEYREAARLDPTSASYAENVARMSWALGDIDDSVLWFERALQFDPLYVAARARFSHVGCLVSGRNVRAAI